MFERLRWVLRWSAAPALALAFSIAPSTANAIYCSNCANVGQMISLMAITSGGFANLATAIQGAATSTTSAIDGAAQVTAEANAKTAADTQKAKSQINYQPIDPCAVSAMTNGTTGGVGRRPCEIAEGRW